MCGFGYAQSYHSVCCVSIESVKYVFALVFSRYIHWMNDEFIVWLEYELKERGWSKAELSRRSSVSASAIHKTMGRENKVTFEFCNSIAYALGDSPVRLMRMAGLLPRVPDVMGSEYAQIVLQLLSEMDEVNRADVMTYARMRMSNPIGG